VGRRMIYGGKDLWNRCVLSLEWKREEVMDGVKKQRQRKLLPRFVVSFFPFLIELGIDVFNCQTQRP